MEQPNKQTEETPQLKKVIGVFGGSNILIGIMIGSGIFYIGSYVLQRAHMSMGLALLAWLIGGLVTLLGSLCFAELGAMNPATGGIYVYLSDAYSPVVGYMFNFQSMIIGGPGSIAAIAIALPMALNSLIPMNGLMVKVWAIALIVIFTLINYFGVDIGEWVQNVFNVLKVLPLILIIVLGLFWGHYTPNLSLTPRNGSTSPVDFIQMMAFAVIASLWAYEGWTNLNTVAGEMKNPQRNLPRALILSVGFTTVVYVLFNLAIYRALPFGQISRSIQHNQLYLGTAVAQSFLGQFGTILVAIAMVLAMISSLNGMILAFARYYYAAAKDHLLWKSFAHVNAKHRTPDFSLFIQMLISIALVMTRELDELTSLVVFSGAIFNCLSVLAVPMMRRRQPDTPRPYKVWAYPWTVIIATIAFLIILGNNFIDDPVTSILGLVVPAIGAMVYWGFRKYYHVESE
ncbi:amino acid permease [Secundilactobacillus silagincola]|uniref:Amino acid permease n=1 Tax=Secundilactobacillus silagincola TaxID=1714681 RepID=A0A1Z5J5F9_9LACO|nr:amino acid permease [Secundilactobacillus silagincola]GAX09142.1 amino acid permease [Secundilactobacillus silagincola]